MDDYLMHYGRLGMKWGKHIFGETRANKRVGLHRTFGGYVIKKDSQLTRWSDKKERNVRTGAYASITKQDVSYYQEDAIKGYLGFKVNKSKLMEVKIKAVDDAYVLGAKQVIKSVVDSMADPTMTKRYKLLKKYNYLYPDPRMRNRLNKKTREYLDNEAKRFLHDIHKYIYADRDGFAEKFKAKGFDAIIDPEDFMYGGYQAPMIITNAANFKISSIGEYKVSSKDGATNAVLKKLEEMI